MTHRTGWLLGLSALCGPALAADVTLTPPSGGNVVIEVNDNPSVEAGVEDGILKDELYLKIMRVMYDRVKKKKNGSDRK